MSRQAFRGDSDPGAPGLESGSAAGGCLARVVVQSRHALDQARPVNGDEKPEDSFEVMSGVASQLTDEQLEAELTIAASNPGLAKRYEVLIAERERRRRD